MKSFSTTFLRLLVFIILWLNIWGTNAISQWVQTTGPYGWEFNHLAVKDATVLAGSRFQGIFRSEDNGSNWSDANEGFWVVNVTALGVFQDHFLAGGWDGYNNLLFLSQDDGKTWSQINTVNPAGEIKCFIEKDGVLLMGTYEDGLYRSADGGINWTHAANNGLEHHIEDLQMIGSNLLAGTWGGGVYISSDDGENWNTISSPDYNFHVTSMVVVNNELFVAYATTVYKTADFGSHWINISAGLPFSYSGNLYASGTNLYIGTDEGIFFSNNGGGNWVNTGLSSAIVNEAAIAGENLIAVTRDLGIFTSPDNGQNWVQTGAYDNVLIQALAAMDSIFITGNNGQEGLFISRDNGNSFSEHCNLNHSYVLALKVRGTDIFAGTEVANTGGGGIFKSSDGGKTWNYIGLQNVIVVSFTYHSDYLFAGTVQGVYRTQTEGAIWNHVNNGLNSMRVDAMATIDTVVYAGTGYGVYRTDNNGTNWSLYGLADTAITSLLNVEGRLFASTYFGIYALANDGAKWEPVGLQDTAVYKLELSPSLIIAGTQAGVFVSGLNGTRWIPVNENLNCDTQTLAINDQYVFAGTWGEGVWRRSLSDIITGIDVKRNHTPRHFSLEQNYPNPFNPATIIPYHLPVNGKVSLLIYNALGQKVRTLINTRQAAGSYQTEWNGRDDFGYEVASGVYIARLKINGRVTSRKMLLLR